MLAVRQAQIAPLLAEIHTGGRFTLVGAGGVVVRWGVGRSTAELTLAANLTAVPMPGFPPAHGRTLWREGAAGDGWHLRAVGGALVRDRAR